MMFIPPASDVEAMAKFLDANPAWSPVFNDEGVQIGVATCWFQPLPRHFMERASGNGA